MPRMVGSISMNCSGDLIADLVVVTACGVREGGPGVPARAARLRGRPVQALRGSRTSPHGGLPPMGAFTCAEEIYRSYRGFRGGNRPVTNLAKDPCRVALTMNARRGIGNHGVRRSVAWHELE